MDTHTESPQCDETSARSLGDAFERHRYSLLKLAVMTLAGVCDGAQMRDDQGFDGGDAKAGHLYALLPLDAWPLAAFHRAWTWTRKYHRQLEAIGDVSQLPEPPRFDEERYQISSIEDGTDYYVVFPNSGAGDVREAFLRMPGHRSHKKTYGNSSRASFWYHTFRGDGQELLSFANAYGFRLGPDVRERLRSQGEVRYELGAFALFFEDRSLNAQVKAIPMYSYSNAGGFHWVIPERRECAGPLLDFLTRHHFTFVGQAEERLHALEQVGDGQ